MQERARWAVLAAVVISWSAASTIGARAYGAPAPVVNSEAEAHIQKGIELRRKTRDAEALAEFEQAMKIAPSARAKGQVGLAQMAVGLFEASEATLASLLSTSADEPWVASHRAALDDALAKVREHLGTLTVSGSPNGATVEVNGTAVGAIPCSVRVQAGDLVVRVAAAGFIPVRRTVSVEARRISSQVFTLVRVAAEAPPVASASTDKATGDSGRRVEPTAGAPSSATGGASSGATAPPPNRGSGESHGSAWPWVTAGGSLLALGFGAFETVRWSSKASEFNEMKDAAGNPICGTSAAAAGGDACGKVLNEGRTAQILAIGGLAVGAALGITSVILFLREPSGDSQVALSCSPVWATPGLVCAARF